MGQILNGLEQDDYSAVYRAAHQMKPSIDFFNIEKGKSVVREIELEAKNENPNRENLIDLSVAMNDIVVSCIAGLKADLDRGL